MTAVHRGSCRCGAIRFEITADPVLVGWCHCASCRKQTGAPVAAFADFPRGALRFVAGEPARFESSPGIFRGFCKICGSALTFEDAGTQEICVHIGAMDHPEAFHPTAISHEAARLPWMAPDPAG